jgi:hypothetical protein
MKPNEPKVPENRKAGRARKRLAESAAEDRRTAIALTAVERIGESDDEMREVRVGELILSVIYRMDRVSDLATLLSAAARKSNDTVTLNALSDSPSTRNANVK